MDKEIQEHLAEFTLDIRKLKDKKILDQKVHVDTFAFTAECILEWLEDPSNPPQYIKKGKLGKIYHLSGEDDLKNKEVQIILNMLINNVVVRGDVPFVD